MFKIEDNNTVLDIFNKIESSIFHKNLKYLESVFSDNVVYYNIKGIKINKIDFLTTLRDSNRVKFMNSLKIKIENKGTGFARIMFTRHIQYFNLSETFNERYYNFHTRDGRWFVTGAGSLVKSSTSYVATPVTPEEIKISKIIENIVKAIANKDLIFLDLIIDKNAIFVNKNGTTRKKEEFLFWFKNSGVVNSFDFLNITFDFNKEKSQVSVFFTKHIIYLNLEEIFENRCYKFINNFGTWKIVSSIPN